jgi:hypothetical protein
LQPADEPDYDVGWTAVSSNTGGSQQTYRPQLSKKDVSWTAVNSITGGSQLTNRRQLNTDELGMEMNTSSRQLLSSRMTSWMEMDGES